MSQKRIAVIAVHGVGDHEKGATARQIGDLLNSKTAGWPGHYTPFTEVTKRIGVAKVEIGNAPKNAEKEAWGPMAGLAKTMGTDKSLPLSGTDSIGHQYLKNQLEHYNGEGPEDTYLFTRLEGERLDPQHGNRNVDIYEMYWADLSRLGNAFTQIFGELYQILFHLGTIGVNNIFAAMACTTGKESAAWRRYGEAEQFAADRLARDIPLLNLWLAALVVPILAASLVVRFLSLGLPRTLVLAALLFILTLVGGIYSIRKSRSVTRTILGTLIGIGLVGASTQWDWLGEPALAAISFLAAFVGIALVADAYDKRRPGALRRAMQWWFSLLAISLAAGYLVRPADGSDATIAFYLHAVEIAVAAVSSQWILFVGGYFRAEIAGRAAVKAATTTAEAPNLDRAIRTRWTARLVIALSATLFLALTVSAWTAIEKIGINLLPGPGEYPPMFYRSVIGELVRFLGAHDALHQWFSRVPETITVTQWADALLLYAGLFTLPALMGLSFIALLITLFAIGPSVIDELQPPEGPQPANAAWQENWLTHGFHRMRWSGALLIAVIYSLPIAFLALSYWLSRSEPTTLETLERLSEVATGAGTIGLFSFSGRLKSLALGFRPVVRAALDVDNWLREHPLDSNPTAHICGRYVSLLRYICLRKENGEPYYNSIVVIAHSQGTVITSDLFRFLAIEHNADPDLTRFFGMRKLLFTMGSPIHQLYGQRFPFLYDYGHAGPDPAALGVTEWANHYRAGDYIGRQLWPDGDPRDKLIGPGAHTHYWDHTAVEIATKLDDLISRA